MPRTWGIGSEEGFTLLELMVVLAILVMVAALFPVALDRALPGRRVSAAAQQLASVVREAQADSVFSGRPVTLRLQEHRLAVEEATASARSAPLPQSVALSMSDQDGRPLTALILYPDGSTQGALLEVDDTNHREVVHVSAVTGRVSVGESR